MASTLDLNWRREVANTYRPLSATPLSTRVCICILPAVEDVVGRRGAARERRYCGGFSRRDARELSAAIEMYLHPSIPALSAAVVVGLELAG
jgi:hypothetical protein